MNSYLIDIFVSNLRPDDVNALMSVKLALKYSGRDVEALKAIAQASKNRSLADFQKVCFVLFDEFNCINKSNFRH